MQRQTRHLVWCRVLAVLSPLSRSVLCLPSLLVCIRGYWQKIENGNYDVSCNHHGWSVTEEVILKSHSIPLSKQALSGC